MLREWKLEKVLGVGGFGIVYRGRGLYFDEIVAIKEYFPSAISDRTDATNVSPNDSTSEEVYALGLMKFLEEAKVLWNLSKPERHPHIVSVRSLFEINGTAYMVMDFESGVSLSQLLKTGKRFDEQSLMRIFRPISEGLDRAHGAGVLHRDIKPANILIDDQNRPVLIDFGSARFDSGQATSTKVTFYTPPYAAIEQYVKTYPQGPWTDIYALGVTLYECITGEKPPEVLERLHGGLGEDLSSRDWPGFSKTFTRAVDAAMAPKPADRPQSISQWLRMFEPDSEPLNEEATRIATFVSMPVAPKPATAPPVTPPAPAPAAVTAPAAATQTVAAPAKKNTGLLVGGAVGAVVLGLAGAGAMLLKPGSSKPPVAAAPAMPIAAAPKAAATGGLMAPKLSPLLDGLVSDAQSAGRPAKELAALGSARTRITALTTEAVRLEGKPDGAVRLKQLIADTDQQATDMAASVTTALSRDSDGLMRDVLRNPAWIDPSGKGGPPRPAEDVNLVTTFKQSKSGLDAAIVNVAQAPDAAAKLEAARQALSAFKGMRDSFTASKRVFLSAQKQKYAQLDTATRQSAGEVENLAKGAKPWIFASKAEKDAYKLAQDNAAKAARRMAELDALAPKALSATDLKIANGAVTKAAEIKTDLDGLLASTKAALHPVAVKSASKP